MRLRPQFWITVCRFTVTRLFRSHSKAMSKRFFEGKEHAVVYRAARPQYTQELFDTIYEYCQHGGGKFRLAVDVACGTGHQSSLPLLSRFGKVIGVEISEEQLSHAPTDVTNLEFKRSSAENLSFLDSGSVDLVTVATGVHWFDIPVFFQEVRRVLTPGGCLAIYGYGWFYLPEPEAQELVEKFIATNLVDYHHEGNLMVMSGYSSLELPFDDFERHNIDCKINWTVDRVCGFFASTSIWQKRLKDVPDCDSLDTLAKDLLAFYRKFKGEENPEVTVVFPVALLLGRKSKSRV